VGLPLSQGSALRTLSATEHSITIDFDRKVPMGNSSSTTHKKRAALGGAKKGRYRRACRPAVASNPKGRESSGLPGVFRKQPWSATSQRSPLRKQRGLIVVGAGADHGMVLDALTSVLYLFSTAPCSGHRPSPRNCATTCSSRCGSMGRKQQPLRPRYKWRTTCSLIHTLRSSLPFEEELPLRVNIYARQTLRLRQLLLHNDNSYRSWLC
jgi:hypothetical protein